MGWQDRDYHRKKSDDDADDPYEPEEESEYEPDDDDDDNDEAEVADDPEAPGAADVGPDGDEPDLIVCPNCRKLIAEDAEQCPRCGHYLLDEEIAAGKPWWVWVGLALALVVALMWAIG